MSEIITQSTQPTQRKLGRKRPVAHAPGLKLARYIGAGLVPILPPSVDYSAKAMAALSQMYDNDVLGCCVPAGILHLIGLFTGNADGIPVVFTIADVVSLYSAISGYVPGDASTDTGCDEQTALFKWQQSGIGATGTHKILGSLTVDPTNVAHVKAALYWLENLFFGIDLPDAWLNVQPGGVWDVGTPNPANGHCVVACGYNDVGVQVCTWGMVVTITWNAMAQNVGRASGGQLYTVLSQDSISRANLKAPNGASWPQMTADFDALGGSIVIPTSPAITMPAPALALPQATRAQLIVYYAELLKNFSWPHG